MLVYIVMREYQTEQGIDFSDNWAHQRWKFFPQQ